MASVRLHMWRAHVHTLVYGCNPARSLQRTSSVGRYDDSCHVIRMAERMGGKAIA